MFATIYLNKNNSQGSRNTDSPVEEKFWAQQSENKRIQIVTWDMKGSITIEKIIKCKQYCNGYRRRK